MATEIVTADKVIYSLLFQSGTLQSLAGGAEELSTRIVLSPAPPGTDEPFITFDTTTTSDLIVVGAKRVFSTLEYLVRVISEEESYTTLEPWATEIDARLHDKSGQTVNGIVYKIWRTRPFRQTEGDIGSGRVFRHLGGFYNAIAQTPIGGQT